MGLVGFGLWVPLRDPELLWKKVNVKYFSCLDWIPGV